MRYFWTEIGYIKSLDENCILDTICIQRGPTKTASLLINTIEMRVLWMEIKYIKSASRLLDRAWVNKRGLDLSKEVLWVSVGQRASELPAIKVGGRKKNSADQPGSNPLRPRGPIGRFFFQTSNFDSWWICSPLTYRDPQYLFRKI